MRGCSTGRLSASLKAAMTIVRRSAFMAGWYWVIGSPSSFEALQVSGAAHVAHLALDRLSTPLHIWTGLGDAVATRARQHGGHAGSLCCGEACGVLPEVRARGSLRAVHPVTELGDIDVHLHDAVLGPHRLDEHGVPG